MDRIYGKICDKIFGKNLKLLFLFLLINNFACYGVEINLNITSLDGFKLDKAAVGVPFLLEVNVQDSSNINGLKVEGLQNFAAQQMSVASRNINGKLSAKVGYQVRIDKPGVFKIGPAKIEDGGKVYESSPLELEVAQEQVFKDKQQDGQQGQQDISGNYAASSAIGRVINRARNNARNNVSGKERINAIENAKNSEKQKDVFAKLFSDKDKETVVLGEKISCTLRFYCIEGKELAINGQIFPEIKDFKIEEEKNTKNANKGGNVTQGTEKIDGNLYNYVQWAFTIIPKKVGTLTMPAGRVVFTVEADEVDDIFSGFGFSSFFSRQEQKSVFSNALSFKVQDLPKYDGACDGAVDAVGKFISFDASVDRTVAKQGDGISYTLELEGQGDLDSIDIKQLQDIPKDLKYYDSKRYLLDNSAKIGMKKKRFEFIVQGLSAGDIVIPSQKFTFFDTQTRKYKVLKSNPVSLQILPSAAKGESVEDGMGAGGAGSGVGGKKSGGQNSGGLNSVSVMPICQEGNWHACHDNNKEKKINFWLFLLLILLPVFLFFIVFLKKLKLRFAKSYSPNIVKKNAFAKAIKSLNIAKDKNDLTCLYSIFVTLFYERFSERFSERFCLDESFVTCDEIINILSKNNFLQSDLQEWEIFFEKIAAYAFYDKNKVGVFDAGIFSQAIAWVDKFKNKFKN